MRFIKPHPGIRLSWRNRPKLTGPGKLLGPILGLSLATIATAVYLSPSTQATPGAFVINVPTNGHSTSHSAAGTSPGSRTSTGSSAAEHKIEIVRTMAPDTVHVTSTRTTTKTDTEVLHSVKTMGPVVKAEYCAEFKWQQDAQAAYLANLSDPWGLDGAPGPNNGDGLACTNLPVDPSRPASVPADPFVAPAPADKSSLMEPADDYYGVAEDGLPGSTPILDGIDAAAGKAPSALEWFSYWPSPYDAAKVQESWAVDALPVITWMSEPASSGSQFTLANIVSGQYDSYLLSYAGSVLATGLPVVIRFDHEMNGNWYPWSAGYTGNKGAAGQPNLYVQAWRHVWNIFNSVGANSDVIWLWSVERVDTMKPDSTTGGSKGDTSPAEDYPGDQYVDWVGMSAYEYKPSEPWTFNDTFSQTLTSLGQVTPKPIFIAETGAAETAGSPQTDVATQKAAWTTNVLNGVLADPDIIGFVWFNNPNDTHTVDGQVVPTDWQFTSSPEAQTAFVTGIDDPGFSSGLMPDGT